jgi:ABC-2 type transport system permease protein
VRTWTIVARRELVERARDRTFVISTAITLLVLVGFIVATALLDREPSYDLAVVGDGSAGVARDVAAAGVAIGVEIRVDVLPDEAAAERAVRDADADAALVDGERIVVRAEPPTQLVSLIQAASLRERARVALEEHGLTPEEADEVLARPPLPVEALDPVDARRREHAGVAIVGVLALYGQLFAYGYWIAAGVMEEKASRVIEVLLATVRPSELLRGKIFGIGLLGLAQLLVIGVVGLATAIAVGRLAFPSSALATVGLVLFWFVLGYFFYAGLFAVAGSIVARQEDLQATMTPLAIVIVGSFLVGIGATSDPSSPLATVASLLPFSAPLVMPSRIVLGEASVGEVALSIVVSLGATAALIPLATKIYSRALLQPGRVRLRRVLRAT